MSSWLWHLLTPLQWSMICRLGFSCCSKIHIVLPPRRVTVYTAVLTCEPCWGTSTWDNKQSSYPCCLPIAGTATGLVPPSAPAWGLWAGACGRQSVPSEPYPPTLHGFANPNQHLHDCCYRKGFSYCKSQPARKSEHGELHN